MVVHVQPRSISTAGHKKDLARLTFYKVFFEGLPNYCLYHDSWAWEKRAHGFWVPNIFPKP